MHSCSTLLRTKAFTISFLFSMGPLVTGYARVFTDFFFSLFIHILYNVGINTGAPLTSPSSLTSITTHCDMAALTVTTSTPQYRVQMPPPRTAGWN